MLDKAEQDAIKQILRRDSKANFLDNFERDLLNQILRRHSGGRSGPDISPSPPPVPGTEAGS